MLGQAATYQKQVRVLRQRYKTLWSDPMKYKHFLSRTMMWHALGLLQEKRNYIELDYILENII